MSAAIDLAFRVLEHYAKHSFPSGQYVDMSAETLYHLATKCLRHEMLSRLPCEVAEQIGGGKQSGANEEPEEAVWLENPSQSGLWWYHRKSGFLELRSVQFADRTSVFQVVGARAVPADHFPENRWTLACLPEPPSSVARQVVESTA
ncbi:hypothetical protein [Fimbriiglobus ruber]|uniref:Uncharacterized protein n=1 Tax=Fimbriiglobus ruber TaxID=1908690 RepID=A0A225CYA7_9BACT|nr:hypothetical protein [Fimbriiglobus ruber]OWK34321.1 hypothetical protein FRUB_10292 [Fimbriiglobus ruber]